MKAIFFSDVHLDRKDNKKTDLVKDFIREICPDADVVVVLGDLFEFFYGYTNYIYPWYRGIIDLLREITEKGKQVYFLEGNHEFSIGRSLKPYAGIECLKELSLDIDGKKVFVAHGNELIRNNFLMFLKSKFVYSIMEFFGPALTWKIAMLSSIFLSDRKKPYRESVKKKFRKIAEKKLNQGFDVVILAHTHMPDMVDYTKDGKEKTYLNTGDLYRYDSYIEYKTESGFAIKGYKKP